jgi:hypothetical protein
MFLQRGTRNDALRKKELPYVKKTEYYEKFACQNKHLSSLKVTPKSKIK